MIGGSVTGATAGAFPMKRRVKQKRGAATRAALIAAVIEFAKAGQYRATTRQLGQYVGVHHTAVNRHFGAVHLLYRVVARENWREVCQNLPFALWPMQVFPEHHGKAAAWAILVGEPRE